VRYLFEIAAAAGLSLQNLTGCRVAAVGRATATAVKARGLGVNMMPSRPNASTLARELKYIKGRGILLLRSEAAELEPANIIRARGAEVTDLPVYRTLPVTDPDPAYEPLLTYGQIGAHVFASPTAVDGLSQRLSEPALERARALPAACIGNTTAAAAESAGFMHTRTSPEPSVLGLIRSLSDTINAR
jgi:uroporphyrinogen-III synthase